MKKKYKISAVVLVIIFVTLFSFVYFRTGFFNTSNIDSEDLSYWNYSNGVIVGGESFEINGSKGTCWLLIHGYSSTPTDLKGIGLKVNEEFGDYVYAPRLLGHSEVPSHILNLSLYEWYNQMDSEFNSLNSECENVNVIGFSFGGAIATKLAEEKELNHVYLIAPFFGIDYKSFLIFPVEFFVDFLGDEFVYSRKFLVGQINSKEGRENYISYWNMPFAPVKNSIPFVNDVRENFELVSEPILIQHSKKDGTASYKGSLEAYDLVSSEIKEMVSFEKSNHVVTFDYDKDAVLNNIIEFEKNFRL